MLRKKQYRKKTKCNRHRRRKRGKREQINSCDVRTQKAMIGGKLMPGY